MTSNTKTLNVELRLVPDETFTKDETSTELWLSAMSALPFALESTVNFSSKLISVQGHSVHPTSHVSTIRLSVDDISGGLEEEAMVKLEKACDRFVPFGSEVLVRTFIKN